MDLLNLNPKSFGLDFSDLSLKIVGLKKKGRFLDLACWGEIKLEPGIIEKGEIKDEELLVRRIQTGITKIKGKKLRTKNVVASLPESKAFLQVIKMPKMAKEELKTAVPFEAENYVPMSIEEVYLDFQIVPSIKGYASDHIDVLIAAVDKKTVDSYVSFLKKAGFSLRALEVESQSISRALTKNNFSAQPVIIVDFGRSRASFIIFSGHSIRFTSSIPISSHKLTKSISRSLKIDLIEAEKIKIRYGLKRNFRGRAGKGRFSQKKIYEAMSPVLYELVSQIKKYLDYYQSHAKNGNVLSGGQAVNKIILCGRGANLKGLSNFLSSELKASVEIGNPWINILSPSFKKIPELSFNDSLGYTSALGLALRGIKPQDM